MGDRIGIEQVHGSRQVGFHNACRAKAQRTQTLIVRDGKAHIAFIGDQRDLGEALFERRNAVIGGCIVDDDQLQGELRSVCVLDQAMERGAGQIADVVSDHHHADRGGREGAAVIHSESESSGYSGASASISSISRGPTR